MANEKFNPQYSTNDIWYNENTDECLTDHLVEMESDIAGKATATHTHDGYAASTHTHAQSDITGLADALATKANATTLTSKADLVNGTVPESQLPSYVDDVVEYANLSAFPTAGESGKVYLALDTNKAYRWGGSVYVEIAGGVVIGETAATAHRGDHGKIAYDHSQDSTVHVTSDQKTAWDSKAAGDHTHAVGAITGLLDMLLTDTAGRQKTTITGNVLTAIAGLPAGVHTCYSAGGSSATATNAPNTIESWRYLIHKNYAAYGWVLAFGSEGSVFTNYYDGGTWRGWKPIWDNNPEALWSGAMFMNAAQTVTPAKKLSECRGGWILLWSDYDTANGAATNGDVFASYVPKRCYSGGNWAGHSWLVDIPVEAASSAETRCIKKLYMWNDRIVGNSINETSPRNDVVLRAVYEF